MFGSHGRIPIIRFAHWADGMKRAASPLHFSGTFIRLLLEVLRGVPISIFAHWPRDGTWVNLDVVRPS